MTLSKASPHNVEINGKTYQYLAFYYPGHNTDWDNVYGVPYFGNFWIESFDVQLKTSLKANFHTAEAAYQASKWWNDSSIVKAFEQERDGNGAFSLKKRYTKSGIAFNGNYGGYPTGEDAMFEILKHKFSKNQLELHNALGATGNTYLLEHSAKLNHPDWTWSDGNDGTGTNHLGECLMRVRDFYFPGQGNPLTAESSATVIMACTQALRTEMTKLGLSAHSRYPTH